MTSLLHSSFRLVEEDKILEDFIRFLQRSSRSMQGPSRILKDLGEVFEDLGMNFEDPWRSLRTFHKDLQRSALRSSCRSSRIFKDPTKIFTRDSWQERVKWRFKFIFNKNMNVGTLCSSLFNFFLTVILLIFFTISVSFAKVEVTLVLFEKKSTLSQEKIVSSGLRGLGWIISCYFSLNDCWQKNFHLKHLNLDFKIYRNR